MPRDMPSAEEVPPAEDVRDHLAEADKDRDQGSAEGEPDPGVADDAPATREDEK